MPIILKMILILRFLKITLNYIKNILKPQVIID